MWKLERPLCLNEANDLLTTGSFLVCHLDFTFPHWVAGTVESSSCSYWMLSWPSKISHFQQVWGFVSFIGAFLLLPDNNKSHLIASCSLKQHVCLLSVLFGGWQCHFSAYALPCVSIIAEKSPSFSKCSRKLWKQKTVEHLNYLCLRENAPM